MRKKKQRNKIIGAGFFSLGGRSLVKRGQGQLMVAGLLILKANDNVRVVHVLVRRHGQVEGRRALANAARRVVV